MRILLLASFLFIASIVSAQALHFSCAKDTTITGCASTCVALQTKIPDLFTNTGSYAILQGNTPSGNCYQVAPTNPASPSTSASLTIDDRYSSVITLPFPFKFFGQTYTQLVASTNGYISFDVSLAGAFSHYQILNNGGALSALNGNPGQNLPSTLYDGALIMGAYQDLDPAYTTSATQQIGYSVVGTAPYRKWILSFYKVPQFNCQNLIQNTQQIILNESTGIIEVLIYNREPCASWNEGKAMIGIQDMSKTQAQMVPGRTATDPAWSVTSTNNSTIPMESYSFLPAGVGPGSAGSTSLFKRVELVDLAGNIVATGTTTPNSDGTRSVNFSQICTPVGTTTLLVRAVYAKNDNLSQEVFGLDTLRVIKSGGVLSATTSATGTTCVPNGQIAVNVTAGASPYTYSIDGGNFGTSNTFTGLGQGNHIVTVKDNLGCTFNYSNVVNLTNNLTLTTNVDTSICIGGTFNGRVTTNATNISWSPAANVSNPTIPNPVITATRTQVYSVTGSLGVCTITKTFNVSTFPAVTVNAGPDQTIIAGDVVQLNATAAGATSYVWTPATGLSATNILNPSANPAVTTNYTLTATDSRGCKGTDDVLITVVPNCIQPMEAFTPNGDGINDLWMITNGRCLQSAAVQVFNRYGNKVYENTNYNNTWNGTFEGKPLPDGTYYYVISYQLINNKKVQLKGNVTILR